MIDANSLVTKIIQTPDYIETILEKLGHSCIKNHGKYFSCMNLDGDNPGAIVVYKDNLYVCNHTRNWEGNILNLVANEKRITFGKALQWICNVTGIEADEYNNVEITLPFGGFYKDIIKIQNNGEIYLKEYLESDLPSPNSGLSKKFFDDGISYKVQELHGIRMCHDENCILIPIFDRYDRLVGCKARNNDPSADFSNRWWAYLPYLKTSVVYGLNFNYNHIIDKSIMFIGESEKAPLQAQSFECNLFVSPGGHKLDPVQCKQIKSVMSKRIVLAYDEDISEEELQFEANKLVIKNTLFKNQVGYIYDNGIVRPKGSKLSPTDGGKKMFSELVKNHIKWLDN